jgi:hypothetical protein
MREAPWAAWLVDSALVGPHLGRTPCRRHREQEDHSDDYDGAQTEDEWSEVQAAMQLSGSRLTHGGERRHQEGECHRTERPDHADRSGTQHAEPKELARSHAR